MGRWASTTLTFPKSKWIPNGNLHIYSICRATSEGSGHNSTLAQQRRALAIKGKDPKHQQAYIEDLDSQPTALDKGDSLILAGDINCTLDDTLMKKLMPKHSITDIMFTILGETPPTRSPGTRTINHVTDSTKLKQAIRNDEYLPFGYGINSDHQAIIVDIDMKQLHGRATSTLSRGTRKLQSRNCVSARSYREEMSRYLQESGSFERLHSIKSHVKNRQRRRAIRGLELFDRSLTKNMLQAAKTLRRKPIQLWSPKLQDAVKLFHYWQALHRANIRGKRLHQVIEKLEETITGLEKDQGQTRSSVRRQIKTSLKIVREITKNNREIRKKFLRETLHERSEAEARLIKTILFTEHIIKLHQNFNTISKKPRRGINTIIIPNMGDEIILESREEVEKVLHEHNINHFRQPQVRCTPFATNPLLQHLAYGLTSPEANYFVTNPRHKLPFDFHPLVREVLEELRPRQGEPPPADISISVNDLQEAYKK